MAVALVSEHAPPVVFLLVEPARAEVEHPARVSCGPVTAVTKFRPSYNRAAVMETTLALIGRVVWPPAWRLDPVHAARDRSDRLTPSQPRS